MQKLKTHRADPDFKHIVEKNRNGVTLKYCYQCGTCTAACPISKFIDIYQPNKIIELAKLGIRSLPQSNAFLFCSACTLCTKGCPQGVKVHELMQALKEVAPDYENFEETLETLGHSMPFPVTYTWVCIRPTEDEILRTFERELARPVQKVELSSDDRVAVIGSGPAGLTAAWTLAKAGISVTVFESLSELGGMLKVGIPNYRLPNEIVDAEIGKIEALGVEMRTNVNVDKEMFEDIVKNFSAVFIATGAFASRKLRVDGENLQGVVSAIEFLKDYNLTGSANIGKNVVVIGGGNVAMDAAGAAIHCGAESVKLFCLEDRATMPAHEWEIQEIADEGVQINPSWGIKAINGDREKVTGVEFQGCKSVFDANKKFNPTFDEKKTQTIEADTVITAIGQAPDLSFYDGAVRGVVKVDPYTMETSLPNVFAGGDAVAGTASLVEAITTGKTAANSIIRYLRGESNETI